MVFNSIKEKIIFFNFPVILFSAIPFFLVTGPFLSDVSVSLISVLFLTYCLKKNNFSFFQNNYFYFFICFWLYLIANSLINNYNLDSLKISFFYFRYGVFVVAVVALLKFDEKFIIYFFYCTFICFFVLIFDGLYQYFNSENIFGYKVGPTHRVSSFFGDEYILGSYLSRLWPLFFGLSIFFLKKKKKLFYPVIVIFILSETLIFLSGDRTAFFYINLSAIFVILFSKNLLKIRLVTLFFSILLIIIISLINPSAKERVFDKTLSQMNIVNQNEKQQENVYIFSKQHTHHYVTALRMFLDNKILGVGVKNFRYFCSNKKYEESKLSCSTHPHNTYIQILSETGIIGFLFLISILFYFLKKLFNHLILRTKGKYLFTDLEICILSAIAMYLWPFAPTGNIFNNWLNVIMIINLPFLIWAKAFKNHKY